jgi:serine/threonine-protein kinase
MSDSTAEQARARLGTVLKEKWRLERVLGIGGMATVYAAKHRNGKLVAVKMLHPELSHNPEARERFLREGYAANAVGHRGVVTVDDDDVTDDGSAFVVMELLEGKPVDAWLQKKGRLEPSEALFVADQVLDVLAAAHEKGIVHRDLKPENLFLTSDRIIKVLDFGIARIRELGGGPSGGTRMGTLMGSPGYMAPEQARGRWELVDAQTDLWAVGATMFTLLTGRQVHEAETVNEQLALAVTARAPAIASIVPDLPEIVTTIVDRALAYEKSARWPDARSMQRAVREACLVLQGAAADAPAPAVRAPAMSTTSEAKPLEAGGGALTAPPVASPTVGGRDAKKTRVIVAAALGAAVLLVAGVASVMAMRGSRASDPQASVTAEPAASASIGAGASSGATEAPRVVPAPPESASAAPEPTVSATASAAPPPTATARASAKAKPAAPAPATNNPPAKKRREGIF